MFENHFYELAVLCERSVNLQVIKSGNSIAQDVVVSVSALGSILPKIRNLAIACIINQIKHLISNGYLKSTCSSKGIRIKLTHHNILYKIC